MAVGTEYESVNNSEFKLISQEGKQNVKKFWNDLKTRTINQIRNSWVDVEGNYPKV